MLLHQPEMKAKNVCSDVDGYGVMINLTSGFYGGNVR